MCGRYTGMSLEFAVLSETASIESSLISSGWSVHQFAVATAIFPDISMQPNIESTHSTNESNTI